MGRDIHGLWEIIQDNDFHVPVSVEVVEKDKSFNIEAQHTEGTVTGKGQGTMEPDMVHFRIFWSNGSVGAYSGAFDFQNVLHGCGFDIAAPESSAKWHSSRPFAFD